MTHQVQLDLYEMHTGRRGAPGDGGGPRRSPAAVARGGRRSAAGGRRGSPAGRRRRRPKNSPPLVRPLEHHVQEPNIPFGGIPHFDELL